MPTFCDADLSADPIWTVLSSVPSMLAYWDKNLQCRFANKAYGRWFGVDPATLFDSSLRDLLGPQLFALNEPHILGALRGEPQEFERIVPGPDGCQRSSIAHYLPHVVNGKVAGFVVQVSDTTHLHRLQSQLRLQVAELERVNDLLSRSEEALRQAQRLGGMGSWEWHVASDTTTWSEQLYALFGYDAALPPPGFADHGLIYTPESLARLRAAVERATRDGEPYTLELEYIHQSGRTGWLEGRGAAERNAQGQIWKLFGTAQDITARRSASRGGRDGMETLSRSG